MGLLGRELKCTKKIIEELKAGLVSGAAKAECQRLVERTETSEDYAKRIIETAEGLGAQSRRFRDSLGSAHIVCGPEVGFCDP
ncbi:hypothetical protein DXG03_002721 [Asterophora parasitica]|uniref:Uncharacterized protein n=1 Tax=Asterophora parasitica TaxID=117018 RepID=A0A9P7G1R1_9AGAR|nr:hypothetical protein DXG03_002721 [Asterophora parasitica]